MRKICVVTGTRAEYGLLTPLMKEIEKDPDLTLQLIATGMHLSPEFGMTVKNIEKEFHIDKKIEILLSSDTAAGIAKSMGLANISFAEAFSELEPDIILVLGDRFEILAVVSTALVMNIPVAHLSGGELTYGAIDDSIRHAVTKMSHLHFTATEEYRQRVIRMGEPPERVFNVGEAGLDNIRSLKLLSKDELQKSLGFTFGKKNVLVTYHPVTHEKESTNQFQNLLDALDEIEGLQIIFTKANADAGGRAINQMIDQYAKKRQNCSVYTSLGQLRYLSALQYVDAVVGNSSSGIVEAPSFHIGTINIGNRQEGRTQAESVINVPAEKEAIIEAFKKLYSEEFQNRLPHIKNPYEQRNVSVKIKNILKKSDLTGITKKIFYDAECP